MARWVLVRHGETAWNAANRVQGQIDIALHARGRDQARSTGRALRQENFIAVYASDLSRTTETAKIILEENNGSPELYLRRELREIAYGTFEGKSWPEINALDPETSNRQYVRDLNFAPPEGESFRGLLTRLQIFVEQLWHEHSDDDLLVVAHGGSLRALAVVVLGLPWESIWNLRGLSPASVSVVNIERGEASLTKWNEAGHTL